MKPLGAVVGLPAERPRLRSLSPPRKDQLSWGARDLTIQVTLPHRDPGSVPVWHRRNDYLGLTLSIRPGFRTDSRTGEPVCLGYPYGSIPRLLLFWMCTEAVRTHSRCLRLGRSLAEFMRDVGLNPKTGGGKRGDAARLRNQIERLFRASISLERAERGAVNGVRWLDMAVAPAGELWWDSTRTNGDVFFESWVELGERFYGAITERPVPVDRRALKALKQSPFALDIYGWAVYQSFATTSRRRVGWRHLQQQFGASYTSSKDFKKYFRLALAKVESLYRTAKMPLRVVSGGIEVVPGRQLIPSRGRSGRG